MQTAEPSATPARAPAPPWVAAGLLGVLALSAALRFPWLTAEPLWYDEIFSVVVATNFLPDLIGLALADQTNPPGFYLLLAGWIRLGEVDDGWLRLLPAIAGTSIPLALVHAARRLEVAWGPALLAGALAAASPMLVAKSLEVRAYTLLALLATLALAQVAGMAASARTPSRRDFAGLAALFAAMVMLHYFGALSVAALVAGGVLLTRDAVRRGVLDGPAARTRAWGMAVAAIPAAVALATWLALVARRGAASEFGSNASWIEPPTLRSFNALSAEIIGAFGAPALNWAVLSILCVAVLTAVTVGRSGPRSLVVTAAVVPLALALLFGWLLGRPLWVGRYLIAAVPPLLLLLALLVDRVRAPWRTGLVTLAVGWSVLSAVHYQRDHMRKTDWSALMRELAGGAPAVVCVNEMYVSLSLEFHVRRDELPVDVRRFSECRRTAARTWAVYQPYTAESLDLLRAQGATLGPRFSLLTQFPPTEARAVRWGRPPD